MTVQTFGPQDISHGGTYSIDLRGASAIIISQVRIRWKGRSTSSEVRVDDYDVGSSYSSNGSGVRSVGCVMPSAPGGTTCVGTEIRAIGTNSSGSATEMSLIGVSQGVVNNGVSKTQFSGGLSCSYQGSTITCVGGLANSGYIYFSCNGYVYYYYMATVETKTGDTSGVCNGKTCSRTGVLSSGVWSSWVTAPSGFLVDQTLNSIALSVGGSAISSIEVEMTYTAARPTRLHLIKYETPGGTQALSLCSLTDPQLEYGAILRVSLGGTTYCADLVATDDDEAAGIRIATQKGVLAGRKYIA